MDIRKWLGYENSTKELSSVDKQVNLLLTGYYEIISNVAQLKNEVSISSFSKVVKEKDLLHKVHKGFSDWFFCEGEVFLIEIGRNLYAENENLKEEIEYLNFIISSEKESNIEWLDDTLGILIDMSDQLRKLLSKAEVSFTFEPVEYSNKTPLEEALIEIETLIQSHETNSDLDYEFVAGLEVARSIVEKHSQTP